MPALPQDKLAALEKRFESVEAALSAGPSAEEYVRLSKEYAELEPVVRPIMAYRKLHSDLEAAGSGFPIPSARAAASVRRSRPRPSRP
ncbi:MAG: hypothetical protein EOP19_06195, partial [Hyphomicrobiales bacterium]